MARDIQVPQRTRDRQHPILNFEQADNFVLAYYAGGDENLKGLPFEGEPEVDFESADNQPRQVVQALGDRANDKGSRSDRASGTRKVNAPLKSPERFCCGSGGYKPA